MYSGSHTGSFIVEDNTTYPTASYSINLVIPQASSLQIPSEISFGDIFQNKTNSATFSIQNTGNRDLTNIFISNNLGTSYRFTLDKTSILRLRPGEKEDISATVSIPFGTDVNDRVNLGQIFVTSSQSVSASSNVYANIKGYLNIIRVRAIVEGRTETLDNPGESIDRAAKPQDTIELNVEVENLFNSKLDEEIDIEDVEVEITIEGIDEDEEDLVFTSETVDLDYEGNDRKHTFEFNFTVPPEAQDDTYPIEIRITGSDEEDNDYDLIWNTELKVERESHDLVIKNFNLAPSTVSCGTQAQLTFDIINAGSNDEDFMRYTIKNDQLGINIDRSRLELSSDPEEEDTLKVTLPVNTASISPGTYPIEARVYRDLSILEDIEGRALVITACTPGQTNSPQTPIPPTQPSTPTTPTQPSQQQQRTQNQSTPTNINPPAPTQPTQQPVVIGQPTTPIIFSFRDSDSYTFILVLANVLVIALIILLIIAYKRK
jgi:hypothetical protein